MTRDSLADVAALIGARRAAMLPALLDGRRLPASELARLADTELSAPATSLYLAKAPAERLFCLHRQEVSGGSQGSRSSRLICPVVSAAWHR